MTAIVRERIAVQLKTALLALPGVTVQRAPQTDFDLAELPALALFMGDEATEYSEGPNTAKNHMEARIIGHVTAANGEAAESAAHALYGAALAAVLADPTQGGLALDTKKTELSITGNPDPEGEIALDGFELRIAIEYWTDTADAAALAP